MHRRHKQLDNAGQRALKVIHVIRQFRPQWLTRLAQLASPYDDAAEKVAVSPDRPFVMVQRALRRVTSRWTRLTISVQTIG